MLDDEWWRSWRNWSKRCSVKGTESDVKSSGNGCEAREEDVGDDDRPSPGDPITGVQYWAMYAEPGIGTTGDGMDAEEPDGRTADEAEADETMEELDEGRRLIGWVAAVELTADEGDDSESGWGDNCDNDDDDDGTSNDGSKDTDREVEIEVDELIWCSKHRSMSGWFVEFEMPLSSDSIKKKKESKLISY